MAADEASGNENERANDAGNNYPPADANNRTFLITASLLTGTLLLLSLFTVDATDCRPSRARRTRTGAPRNQVTRPPGGRLLTATAQEARSTRAFANDSRAARTGPSGSPATWSTVTTTGARG